MRPGPHCAGAAFGGAKIWNSEIWSFLANWRSHCRTDSAGSLHYVMQMLGAEPAMHQLSAMFVTLHTNVIVVTIRISIAI